MNKRSKIILLSALLMTAVSLYVYSEYNRKNKDLVNAIPDLEIQTPDLIKKFETDEAGANKVFLTKKDFVVAVSGKVKELVRDDKGYYTIVLGDTSSLSAVRCSMDSSHQKDLAGVKKGDQLTIQGAVTGFNKDELLGSDVILNRCAITGLLSKL